MGTQTRRKIALTSDSAMRAEVATLVAQADRRDAQTRIWSRTGEMDQLEGNLRG